MSTDRASCRYTQRERLDFVVGPSFHPRQRKGGKALSGFGFVRAGGFLRVCGFRLHAKTRFRRSVETDVIDVSSNNSNPPRSSLSFFLCFVFFQLRAVSKLKEALDQFKSQTGFLRETSLISSPRKKSPDPTGCPPRPSPVPPAVLSSPSSPSRSSQRHNHQTSPSCTKATSVQGASLPVSASSPSSRDRPHTHALFEGVDYSSLSDERLFRMLERLTADEYGGGAGALLCPWRKNLPRTDVLDKNSNPFSPGYRTCPPNQHHNKNLNNASGNKKSAVKGPAGGPVCTPGEMSCEDAAGGSLLPAASLVSVLRDAQWIRVPRNMVSLQKSTRQTDRQSLTRP